MIGIKEEIKDKLDTLYKQIINVKIKDWTKTAKPYKGYLTVKQFEENESECSCILNGLKITLIHHQKGHIKLFIDDEKIVDFCEFKEIYDMFYELYVQIENERENKYVNTLRILNKIK